MKKNTNYFNCFLIRTEAQLWNVKLDKDPTTLRSGQAGVICSRIITSTLFTRLQQANELKFAPLFAPITNLQNQTY